MINVALRPVVFCIALFGLSACADLSSSINVNNAAITDIATIQANNEALARDYFKVNGYDRLEVALKAQLNKAMKLAADNNNGMIPPAQSEFAIKRITGQYHVALARIKKSEDDYLATMRGNYTEVAKAMRANSEALTKMNSGFKLGTVALQIGKSAIAIALPPLAPIIAAFEGPDNNS